MKNLAVNNYYTTDKGRKIKRSIPPDFDIRKYLEDKGIEFKEHTSSRKGIWLQMKCPFPEHDDSRPSFNINAESLSYNCYVCGSGNWFQLCERLGWGDWESNDVIVDIITNNEWGSVKRLLIDNYDNKIQFIAPKPKNEKIIIGDKFYNYLKSRNLHKAIKPFMIKKCTKWDETFGGIYRNRITIPVHDITGENILWYEGRLIIDKKYLPKYYRPDGSEKTKTLFNYHRVKRTGTKEVIVAEGILHAIQLWLWGYKAVCTFGANVSIEQLELLLEFDRIYICYDIDEAGIKGFLDFRDLINNTGTELYRIKIPRGNDVNTITKRKFDKYYNNSCAIEIYEKLNRIP